MVHEEILLARTIPRDTLFDKVNNQKNNKKVTFNITYHLVFCNARKILEEIHVILASNSKYKKYFLMFPRLASITFTMY